jgi:hypothetical protein
MAENNPPVPSIEDQQRLEEIFHPEAVRQRQKVGFSRDGDVIRLVHYTSADVAMKIITNKCIWMRNATCMSDFMEVQHGFGMLLSFFNSEENKEASKGFADALNSCHPNIWPSVIQTLNNWSNFFRYDTYVASISEHYASEDEHGRLSMWRAYGGSCGVAIVFKVPYSAADVYKLGLTFSPVAYLSEARAHEVLHEITSNVEKNTELLKSMDPVSVANRAAFSLIVGAICCKHPGFAEELELRMIYIPTFYMPTDEALSLMKPLTQTIRGVPQFVYPIPLSGEGGLGDLKFAGLFDRLIIGPTQYPLAMDRAFRKALLDAGCESPKIRQSMIPLRT